MAIGVRASGSVAYDASGLSRVITKPAAAAAGDVAIVVASIGWGANGPQVFSTFPGWTSIAVDVGGTSNTERTSAFYRVIQAGDSTWTITFTGNATSPDLGVVFFSFTGVDNTTPIDATGSTATNSGSATISAPAVTVVTNQAWELIGGGAFQGGTGLTAPGFTVFNNQITNEYVTILYNTTPKGTGSTGTVTLTSPISNSQVLSAIPFALRPAGAAAANVPPQPFPGIPEALLAM